MCSSSRARSSSLWSSDAGLLSVVQRDFVQRGGLGHLAKGQCASGDDAEDHGSGEVEGDGGDEGHDQYRGSLREERRSARTLDTSTIRIAVAMRTPASAANGISLDRARERNDDDEQHERVDERGQPGRGAAADVDCGARDGGGRGDAAEERAREVGDALAEQLAVWVVARRTRSWRRRRWPTAGSPARPGRRRQGPGTASVRSRVQAKSAAALELECATGSAPIVATGRSATRGDRCRGDHGDQGDRHPGAARDAEQDQRDDAGGDGDRPPSRGRRDPRRRRRRQATPPRARRRPSSPGRPAPAAGR